MTGSSANFLSPDSNGQASNDKILDRDYVLYLFVLNEETYFSTLIFFSLSGLSKPVITNHNFLAVYFDHRHKDLKLLLNLLAETSGLPESFRILTLFDKKFQSLWKPQNLRFEEYETVGSVTQVHQLLG